MLLLALLPGEAIAHNVSQRDADLISGKTGWQFLLYTYLGAKHMVTGYDHLLFLLGVIFYLTDLRRIALFVSLFALGHSITLIGGVILATQVNPYLVDAVIGLSVAYKGFDNLNGFTALFGERPDEKLAVFVFGLFHGLGLATLYGHLSRIDVAPQDRVAQSDRLGLSGATGLAGGDHLHFAVLLGNTYVDPIEWWDAKWVKTHVHSRLPASTP